MDMEKYNLNDEKTIGTILLKLKECGFDCFVSESQFRDLFALMIAKNHKDFDIFPEFSPQKTSYPRTAYFSSKRSLRFDLLVVDKSTNDKYLFEFKYKTKALENVNVTNQTFDLKNQKDFTNGRYDVWEDIYRIEQFVGLRNNSLNIKCGYVIFLTNYRSYLIKPNHNCKSYSFSLSEGYHKKGIKHWPKDRKGIQENNQEELNITNNYFFKHAFYSTVNDSEFKCLLIRVSDSK